MKNSLDNVEITTYNVQSKTLKNRHNKVKNRRKGNQFMNQVEISNRAIEICSMYDKLDKTAQDAIYMAGKLLLAQKETQREADIRNMLKNA